MYRLSLIIWLTLTGMAAQAQSDTLVTESGLKIVFADKREGLTPKTGDKLHVHFTAMLDSGRVFETTLHNKPYKFNFGKEKVIPAWEEALSHMAPGDRVTVFAPPSMAYGQQGIPLPGSEDGYLVPPDSNVYFKLWLVETIDQSQCFLLK